MPDNPALSVPNALGANTLAQNANKSTPHASPSSPVATNTVLYDAAKAEADKAYKEAMNTRAILFNLARVDDYEDINRPDRIESRAQLALDVIRLYNKASLLYDRADYVLMHGRLPNHGEDTGQEDYEHLADNLVKLTLDNLRKNVNKMKKRTKTAGRLALIQKHEANIKKLEARWHLLKPQ